MRLYLPVAGKPVFGENQNKHQRRGGMTTMNVSNETEQQGAAENRRLAQAIDHTKLTFAPGEDEARAIEKLCSEARDAGFYAVCVRPRHIQQAKVALAGSSVQVATVIGFPNQKVKLADELKQPTVGSFSTADKLAETRAAVGAGADELDWVIDVAALKNDVRINGTHVKTELEAAAQAAQGRPIKVIIETDLLTHDDIVAVSQWCAQTGMAMVKTSTGMVEGGQGATLEAVRLIRETLGKFDRTVGIKASGGIKTRQQALRFLDAGVNRIGTSSGLTIVSGDAVDLSGQY